MFPPEDLGQPPTALWRGYVLYDGTRRFSVWAHVKIRVKASHILALQDLKQGVPIKLSQIKLETRKSFAKAFHSRFPGAAGRLDSAPLYSCRRAGVERFGLPAARIARGDVVTVVVSSGLARISIDAEAQSQDGAATRSLSKIWNQASFFVDVLTLLEKSRWRRIGRFMKATALFLLLLLSASGFCSIIPGKKNKNAPPSALDQYVKDAETRASEEGAAVTPGSAWSGYSTMMDLTHDLRASRVDDVITVIVAESASATSTGNTQTSRKSSANSSITGLPGIKSAAATTALSSLARCPATPIEWFRLHRAHHQIDHQSDGPRSASSAQRVSGDRRK